MFPAKFQHILFAIVMAILTGRADDAEAAMRDHLSGSAALLRGFLS